MSLCRWKCPSTNLLCLPKPRRFSIMQIQKRLSTHLYSMLDFSHPDPPLEDRHSSSICRECIWFDLDGGDSCSGSSIGGSGEPSCDSCPILGRERGGCQSCRLWCRRCPHSRRRGRRCRRRSSRRTYAHSNQPRITPPRLPV